MSVAGRGGASQRVMGTGGLRAALSVALGERSDGEGGGSPGQHTRPLAV